jgi:hypothetical protein
VSNKNSAKDKKNMAKGKNRNRESETVTAADIATVEASELTGETTATGDAAEVLGEQLPAVVPGESAAPPATRVAEGPVTLFKKNTHRNGYHVYGIDGMRGSVFVSKSMIVGDNPPASISISGDNFVYIDPEVTAKKREQREKREERKANLAARRAEKKTKAEARLAKIQAQLEKLKAAEAKEAAKAAAKAGVVAPAEGGVVTEGVEQPFTEPVVTE